MAMTAPYASMQNTGFAARFRDGPAKARKADLMQDRKITGKWESMRTSQEDELAVKKAALKALREGPQAATITAADFRHSALSNATKAGR